MVTSLSPNHFYHDLMNRLLERLDYIRVNPADILNYGLHTDHSHQQLQQRYTSVNISSIHDQIDLKKCADHSVDLVVAHFPLIAKKDPITILREFSRVLRNEGLLLFTSLGPDTFYELRESFLSVDNAPHVYDFFDMHHVGDWLKGLHFSDPVVDREIITIAYGDLSLFFQDLKQLGATNQLVNGGRAQSPCFSTGSSEPLKNSHVPYRQKSPASMPEIFNRSRGLLSKNRWHKMLLQYEQFKKEDYYPVTVELIFGHAWKVKQNQQDEFVISIDQIRRK